MFFSNYGDIFYKEDLMFHYCRECNNFPGMGKQCDVSKKQMAAINNTACGMFTQKSDTEIFNKGESLLTKKADVVYHHPG